MTPPPAISVIVPVRNEERLVADALRRLRAEPSPIPVELVIVDGRSDDGTISAARPLADRVVEAPAPGRAAQMHLGARAARGDLFVFLHADTSLPAGWPALLHRTFFPAGEAVNGRRPLAAAAFQLSFDEDRPVYRLIAALARARQKVTGVPHGDQALVVPRDVYFAAGGFPDAPLMEEYLFVPRLRRLGRVRTLPRAVVTSARRYATRGPLFNALKNSALVLLYHLGVPPRKLVEWY